MTDTDTERDLSALTEDELAAELAREGEAAAREKAVLEARLARIRVLLPELRSRNVKKWGPGPLEALIHVAIERATISKLTARVVGTSKKTPGEDAGHR